MIRLLPNDAVYKKHTTGSRAPKPKKTAANRGRRLSAVDQFEVQQRIQEEARAVKSKDHRDQLDAQKRDQLKAEAEHAAQRTGKKRK